MNMNILSLGAGVQSSTVLLMSCRGVLPKLDAAIFADTGWEPAAVYRWFELVLALEAERAGIPIYTVTKGNIRADAIISKMRQEDGSRWASMPFYVKGLDGQAGMIQRQCTKEYKIEPVQKKLRELASGNRCRLWYGISGDEMRRMRMSKVRWIENYYPLVFGFDRPWHRRDCLQWLADNGFPEAPRSACIGCPYHSDAEWRRMKLDQPAEWADAVEFDRATRKVGGLRGDTYLHRSCLPLDKVDMENLEDKGQQNWLNECEGMCGV